MLDDLFEDGRQEIERELDKEWLDYLKRKLGF